MADWQWWAGRDEEYYTSGPYKSREAAIEQGHNDFCDDEHFVICEAVGYDVTLDADRLLDNQYFEQDDLFDYEHAEPEWVGPPEAHAVAKAALQASLDQWVVEFGHCLAKPNMFGSVRNHEAIKVVHDD